MRIMIRRAIRSPDDLFEAIWQALPASQASLRIYAFGARTRLARLCQPSTRSHSSRV